MSATAVGVLPLAVEVRLPASGTIGHTDDWFRDPIVATHVEYRAFRSHQAQTGQPIVVACVTAYSRTGRNKSWFDPSHYVAPGLDASTPPAWVPEPPTWFQQAVADMAATCTPTASTTASTTHH